MQDAELEADLQNLKPQWHALDFIGLALGMIPFVLSYSTSKTSYSTITSEGMAVGERVTKHVDYVALAGGGGAILCALIGLMFIGKMRRRPPRLAVFLCLLALGAFQILRGVLALGANAFI